MTIIHENLIPELPQVTVPEVVSDPSEIQQDDLVLVPDTIQNTSTEASVLADQDAQAADEVIPSQGRLKRAMQVAKTALLGAAVVFEINPLGNEVTRAAVYSAVEASTHNPGLTALATGAATFAIEATGAMATAELFTGDGEGKVYNFLDKLHLTKIRTNKVTEAASSMALGVPMTMGLKQLQHPERTKKENRRFGLMASAGVSAAVGAMSLLPAEGMSALENLPEQIGVGALALGGLAVVCGKLRNYVTKKGSEIGELEGTNLAETQVVDIESESTEKVAPDYELPQEELDQLEREIVDMVRAKHGKAITSLWVPSDSKYANFVRTHENTTFSKLHIPDLFGKYEDESAFLVMVDTRRNQGRAIRGTRLSSPQFNAAKDASEGGEDGEVRIAMIQDMVEAGQFTNEEFVQHCKELGLDPNKCLSVETNFRIGERVPRAYGVIPAAELSYLAMYNFAANHSLNVQDAAIFAHINEATTNSLNHMGIPTEPLMGDRPLQTPAADGSYDSNFKPVALFNTPKTARKMRMVGMVAAPKEMRI